MKQISVSLEDHHIQWLDSMLNRSYALRLLIDWAIASGWVPKKNVAPSGMEGATQAVRAKALPAYAGNDENMSHRTRETLRDEDQNAASYQSDTNPGKPVHNRSTSLNWSIPS